MDNFSVTPLWITFPRISFEARSEHDPDADSIEPAFAISSAMHWDPEDATLNVNVVLKNSEEEDPAESNREYNFSIHAYGVFEVSDDFLGFSEETAKGVLTDISMAMLGSIRETLTSLTSRSPWGSYTLPFLDADELVNNLYNSAINKKKNRKA